MSNTKGKKRDLKRRVGGNAPLTKQEEVFVNELVCGAEQVEALKKAYPHTLKWKKQSQEVRASQLAKMPKIKARYDELLEKMRVDEQAKSKWTREMSIQNLRFVIDQNRAEMERINQGFEEELERLQLKIIEDPDNAEKYVKELIERKKEYRIRHTNNSGIITAVSELNKMQGFNSETINMNETVVFVGEDELED